MTVTLANAALAMALLVGGAAWAAIVDHVMRSGVKGGSLQLADRVRTFLSLLFAPDPGHQRIDRVLFRGAAPVAITAVGLGAIVVPIGDSTAALPGPQLAVGIFFYLVVLDVMAVALFMAGWGANARPGTEAAFLAGAQLVSYLIPLGFAVTGAVMAAESLSATTLVLHQRVPFGLWQPLGLAIYLVAAMGQTYRPPVDLPVGGDVDVRVEYRGAARRLLDGSLYAVWFLAASMGVLLFLGGWRGPWLPGQIWFVLKTTLLLIMMAWLGVRFRRLTMAQLIRGAWLVLIPASIFNVILVGILMMLAS
ncbi:MAG: hypothetical protein DMF84_24565 [Acidobacteria bacterium]|nr:MAG: hypothetical protein DMF84_24565 [Acidobacteriota bacterium]